MQAIHTKMPSIKDYRPRVHGTYFLDLRLNRPSTSISRPRRPLTCEIGSRQIFIPRNNIVLILRKIGNNLIWQIQSILHNLGWRETQPLRH